MKTSKFLLILQKLARICKNLRLPKLISQVSISNPPWGLKLANKRARSILDFLSESTFEQNSRGYIYLKRSNPGTVHSHLQNGLYF